MKIKKDSGWNKIYENPGDYTYYDLQAAHQDLGRVVQRFKENGVKTILDLGCGIGRNMIPLLKDGFKVYGIDKAESGITFLNEELRKQKLNAEVQVGKFQNLPYPKDFFDAVVSVQTLNHGYEKDIEKGFAEIMRVLKPQGWLFLTVPGRVAKGKVRYNLVKTAKKVEEHTFIPTKGEEIGSPHFIFNLQLLRKYLKSFTINSLWKDDKDYYCVLAKLNRI